MKITYIHHSGVMVELKEAVLLFDYWKGDFTFPTGKRRTVFISHAHHDHYNPAVLEMDAMVIADASIPNRGKDMYSVHPGDVLKLDDLTVHVYGSTDEGVSFMVEADGKRIFHAGDLNYWHWRDESTYDEIKEAQSKFDAEIAKIPLLRLDLAMFPVDARMGSGFYEGADLFIAKFRPEYFLPIHFTSHIGRVDEFARSSQNSTKVLRADLGISIFEI
ncbi:MAG: MBL fold metallo-hydrolase [Erysipelotrichaceae bacterium]